MELYVWPQIHYIGDDDDYTVPAIAVADDVEQARTLVRAAYKDGVAKKRIHLAVDEAAFENALAERPRVRNLPSAWVWPDVFDSEW